MARARIVAVLTLLAAALLAALLPALPATAADVRGPTVAGGDVLVGSGRCTLAFNVSGRGILTGNCGPVGTPWSAGTTPVGTVSWVAADGLTGLITITNPAVGQLPGLRGPAGTLLISSAARATVGRSVQKLSPVSGIHGGTVTAVNVTVNHAGGTVYGLDRSTLCSSTGEGGAPVFAGSVALGISTGGSGNCSSGGTTYSRPVTTLLAALGRSIY